MSLKKIKIINVIFLFLLSFLWHFIYDWFPSFFTAIFFPVNESIWEHMKIIFYVILIGSLLQNYLCKKNKIDIHNKEIEIMTKSVLGVIFYLTIFIPFYLWFGDNMVFAILLMLATYILMEYVGYKILLSDELGITKLPLVIVILCGVLFAILTFYPQRNFLFFDEEKLGYGIIDQ